MQQVSTDKAVVHTTKMDVFLQDHKADFSSFLYYFPSAFLSRPFPFALFEVKGRCLPHNLVL